MYNHEAKLITENIERESKKCKTLKEKDEEDMLEYVKNDKDLLQHTFRDFFFPLHKADVLEFRFKEEFKSSNSGEITDIAKGSYLERIARQLLGDNEDHIKKLMDYFHK